MSEHTGDLKSQTRDILLRLGVEETHFSDGDLNVQSPIDGSEIAHVKTSTVADMDAACDAARDAFLAWRQVPPPHRGELVRLFGEELRAAKEDLGKLVSLEVGKILSEGQGEVQEMIDITDFAVGISRQLYGRTIASERPGHRMMETWHPAGPCGIISAFNFPVAVWSWNATLALVCGDPLVWKPSEKAPLTALASMAILKRALGRFGDAPDNLAQCLIGGADIGEALVDHRHMAIISATGSTAMGRAVGPRVAARFGKSILELGGNNAMIVAPSADLELAVRAIAFSAVGTAGQRCTTLRRVIVHESLAEVLVDRLQRAYATLPIGTPLEPDTLVGPLIDERAGTAMDRALEVARSQGGRVYGGEIVAGPGNGCYRSPALVVMPGQTDIVAEETFAPILYIMSYTDLQEAMDLHNDVPQGLASCIFTTDIREAETFLSDIGSDCGIANVNIGPSGAEIGGAFGGEKETGGGRESGSDAWKGYMRRATNTINYSRELPLAQGVKFDID